MPRSYEELIAPPPSPPAGQRNHGKFSTPTLRWYMRRLRSLVQPLIAVVVVIIIIAKWKTIFPPKHEPSIRFRKVEWRHFAYSQYATDQHYLCNSVMVFEALDRLGSKADRILLYPEQWDTIIHNKTDRISQLLLMAQYQYNVKLIPVPVEEVRQEYLVAQMGEQQFDSSATKFLVFNQTQYLRIIHFDSDVNVLRHMDDLFLLPSAPIAMPRAYWKLPDRKELSFHFFMLEPSEVETARLFEASDAKKEHPQGFDTNIVNNLYENSAMVLPHRKYALITGEFRSNDHKYYHGNDYEVWDPDRAILEASIIHFSDWPLPKPWIAWPRMQMMEMRPSCENNPGTKDESGCRNREIWAHQYMDNRLRRRNICRLLSAPAPRYPPIEKGFNTPNDD